MTVSGDALAAASDTQPDYDPPEYAGLVTRALGLVIDGLVIQFVALFVALATIVVVSLLHVPDQVNRLVAAIGGVAYIAWTVGYFIGFWSTEGQTPGARIMQVRVITSGGGTLRPRWALVRCMGLVLAALPLFAGFAPILFDSRRRGFQDWLARTVVVRTFQPSVAAARMRPRATSGAAPRARAPRA
jgi:uncharacterized RDD family membrane protein YckC